MLEFGDPKGPIIQAKGPQHKPGVLMTNGKLTPRKLFARIFLALMELDDLLGLLPAYLIERVLQAVRPAETREEMYRRRFYLQAAASSQLYMLSLYLFFELRGIDSRLLPFGLFFYFFAVYFFQYRKGDSRLSLACADEEKAERRFAGDLKITKLMLATWAMFFLSIQFLLPH